MDPTQSPNAQPPDAVAGGPSQGMSMSQAMDVLDEFHIKRGDWQIVDAALDVVMGDEPEQAGAPVTASPGTEPDDDEQMATQLFSPGRDRKA